MRRGVRAAEVTHGPATPENSFGRHGPSSAEPGGTRAQLHSVPTDRERRRSTQQWAERIG
eukprot:2518806-Pleurochrysis_carterae.AAC.1